MAMPAPMSWVWERFRSSFRGLHSSDTETDDRSDDETAFIPDSLLRYLARYVFQRPSHRLSATKSCLEDDVATCTACKVTIHQHSGAGTRLSTACPFCGQPYSPSRPLLDPGHVAAGVGAGRVRSHRSTSDPLVSNFRLPPIVSGTLECLNNIVFQLINSEQTTNTTIIKIVSQENEEALGCRRLSSIMVSRLDTMDISELLLRPGSETALPPIRKEKDQDNCKSRVNSCSRRSTPESGLRSALSMETLVSDLEVLPRYPTRHKTRQDFL
ncbi:putative E3 ubiquitin-protein ligase HTD2 [Homalodisca vitripennis]|nr:putative E3 ubiquitin-protein ligase HTD2 [Homalodisca vitripennis]